MRLFFLVVVCVLCYSGVVAGNGSYPRNIWKAVIAESADGSYSEHYAIACCFKNRLDRGLNLGSVGFRRHDLNRFLAKQPHKKIEQAKRVVVEVFESNEYEDSTRGATHFENIEKYGRPWWSRRMVKLTKVGEHTFYRKRKSK